ncbi:hypothetical protein LG293_17865 (plasmid) [Citricoccus nitrophenolicus]
MEDQDILDRVLQQRDRPRALTWVLGVVAAGPALIGLGLSLMAGAPFPLHPALVAAAVLVFVWHEFRWMRQLRARTLAETQTGTPYPQRLAAYADAQHSLIRFGVSFGILATLALIGCLVTGLSPVSVPAMISTACIPFIAAFTVLRGWLGLAWCRTVEGRVQDLEFRRITQAEAS